MKPDIVVLYHSCGFVTPFIPHLIDAGVDVLNSVQPECMDFREIHAEFGGVLSFHGTVGTQTTMPFGTPEGSKGWSGKTPGSRGTGAASGPRPRTCWNRKYPGKT